uniref:Thioesterase domain-containing protein n=1 Tax=Megaselia scalaris TaxID=36166 RepID=T1GG41_MEGSC
MSSGKGLELIKEIMKRVHKGGFDRVIKNVEILSCADGKCSAKFNVSDEQVNMGGGLHGGFTATLVDNITTYALMSKGTHPGVSVDLHVSY